MAFAMKLRVALLMLFLSLLLIPVGCGKTESRQAVEIVSSLSQPISYDTAFARLSIVSGIPPSDDNGDNVTQGDSYTVRHRIRPTYDESTQENSYSKASSAESDTFTASSKEVVSSAGSAANSGVSKASESVPASSTVSSEQSKDSKTSQATKTVSK